MRKIPVPDFHHLETDELKQDLFTALKAVGEMDDVHPLGDTVYDIREREALGWEGPKVTRWSNALSELQKLREKYAVGLDYTPFEPYEDGACQGAGNEFEQGVLTALANSPNYVVSIDEYTSINGVVIRGLGDHQRKRLQQLIDWLNGKV